MLRWITNSSAQGGERGRPRPATDLRLSSIRSMLWRLTSYDSPRTVLLVTCGLHEDCCSGFYWLPKRRADSGRNLNYLDDGGSARLLMHDAPLEYHSAHAD